MGTETKKFISLANLSIRWDRGRQTLWREIQEGKIPSKKMGGWNYVPMEWVLENEALSGDSESK